ncbi:hypothetical protein Lesp02_75310 [Lentzea sp. NBRC 105346]|uniref:hypothetical protein n=1 Tax=Lentzea sp. NBRC 105346 TaxID=3032205 RepID=UPI0024A1DAF3|nr:hypothetical protein [Lentzea sp. NBRC 105346]GLZ35344.1 hypothetical protein Lesp02_75310 [Lentzea sp. NBRC 105346]
MIRWCTLLLLLTACATPAPPVATAPVVRTGADIVLPLDRYLHTAEHRALLDRAADVVGDRCMRRFGLRWEGDPTPEPVSNARRYTSLDAAEAYHPATPPVPRRPPLPAEVKAVWLGEVAFHGGPVPQGGCVGEAMRILKPGIERIQAGLPQRLQWESYGRTRSDERVHRVFAAWSSCMADRGFHYPDPSAAANDPRWRTPSITPQETVVARADVECKLRTNVAGVMLAVETGYQRELIKQNEAALADVMAYADREVRIAVETLGNS